MLPFQLPNYSRKYDDFDELLKLEISCMSMKYGPMSYGFWNLNIKASHTYRKTAKQKKTYKFKQQKKKWGGLVQTHKDCVSKIPGS